MKKLNKQTQYVIYAIAIIFSVFSLIYIAFANTTFTTVLESQKNIIIEEQLEIQEKTSKLKSKLSKYSEELQRLQIFVEELEGEIQKNKDYHNINTGKIQAISATLDLYEGLEQAR